MSDEIDEDRRQALAAVGAIAAGGLPLPDGGVLAREGDHVDADEPEATDGIEPPETCPICKRGTLERDGEGWRCPVCESTNPATFWRGYATPYDAVAPHHVVAVPPAIRELAEARAADTEHGVEVWIFEHYSPEFTWVDAETGEAFAGRDR